MEAAISLGSNLGDRLANLQRARHRLNHLNNTDLLVVSSVYETDPVDVAQDYRDLPFLNAVVILETTIPPMPLLEELHTIETEMGRERGPEANLPRPIDLDIIYVDDLVMSQPALSLPHPRSHERLFVIKPLAEIRSRKILPGQTHSAGDILLSLPSLPAVNLFPCSW